MSVATWTVTIEAVGLASLFAFLRYDLVRIERQVQMRELIITMVGAICAAVPCVVMFNYVMGVFR